MIFMNERVPLYFGQSESLQKNVKKPLDIRYYVMYSIMRKEVLRWMPS